jgi:hypothetical protein
MSADLFSEQPFDQQEPTLQQQAQQTPPEQDLDGQDTGGEDSSQRERYQYWQSKHDKLKADYDRLLQTQQSKPAEPQQPEPVYQGPPSKPSKPVKPANYSAEEAYTNPNSESFRYRSQLDDYNEKYQEYLDYYNDQMQQREEAYRREAEQRELINQARQEVMHEYGLNENEANDFVTVMADPDTMSMKNLVNYYRFLKGESQPTQPQQQQQARQPLSPVRQAPPPPAGVIPASGQPTKVSDEDGFVQAMLNYRR